MNKSKEMSYINILSQVLVPTKLSLPISCATLGTFCSWMISEKTRQTDKMEKKERKKKSLYYFIIVPVVEIIYLQLKCFNSWYWWFGPYLPAYYLQLFSGCKPCWRSTNRFSLMFNVQFYIKRVQFGTRICTIFQSTAFPVFIFDCKQLFYLKWQCHIRLLLCIFQLWSMW